MRRERQYMEPRDRCRANLLTPVVVRDMDYKVQTVRSGEQVLAESRLSLDDVLANPMLLLCSDEAYSGGAAMRIDPFHAAARSLIALRLATGTRDEDVLEAAVAMAVDAIAEHGVPPEIADVHAVGVRANDFSTADVVAALYIPRAEPQSGRSPRRSWIRRVLGRRNTDLTPTVTPFEWADRADAAHTMIGARVSMPAHHPARSEVTAYTEVLLNPALPTELVVQRGTLMTLLLTEWSEDDQATYE